MHLYIDIHIHLYIVIHIHLYIDIHIHLYIDIHMHLFMYLESERAKKTPISTNTIMQESLAFDHTPICL